MFASLSELYLTQQRGYKEYLHNNVPFKQMY